MATLTEKNYISDLVQFEGPQYYSRKKVTIEKNTPSLKIGSVLGQITASKKMREFNPAAADGSEIAIAICLQDISIPADTDMTDVIVLVRHAIVCEQELVFPAGANQTQINSAIEELEALGIKTVQGV